MRTTKVVLARRSLMPTRIFAMVSLFGFALGGPLVVEAHAHEPLLIAAEYLTARRSASVQPGNAFKP